MRIICWRAWHVTYLDSKKIDENSQGLLELKMKAVKEQNQLHKSSRDKGKGHSETQPVKDTVSSIVVLYLSDQITAFICFSQNDQRWPTIVTTVIYSCMLLLSTNQFLFLYKPPLPALRKRKRARTGLRSAQLKRNCWIQIIIWN